ncbi:predicted protein [Naegleria gruberi]|uniref:protein-tyrosine-phosphatase n=1 Tax=Naegleria gruberi TaxID=5762 RepID=D2VQI9_NAEGR|nr:uncharacterized protein NAEGRDRAFT_71241 [Naegleria gruberi]EFC40957.1 predicted protein [Naegleria gruberi]|eukprot:XP_002673701.1 predicted protein [Naegleria gruberi strain NEG-M]
MSTTNIFLINQTHFYNKTLDVASAKIIMDVRSRADYDTCHVRASYSTPAIEDDYHPSMNTVGHEFLSSSKTKLTNLLQHSESSDEISLVLNELYKNVPGWTLRGIGYKNVLLYGGEEVTDLKFSDIHNSVENVQFANCGNLIESPIRINDSIELNDIAKYPVLLLAELLKMEGLVENYSHVVTFKDVIGHQGLYPTEIIENFLFIGNRENANTDKELTDNGITFILNVAEEVDNNLEELLVNNEKKYKYLKLGTDGGAIDHSVSQLLFEKANQFLRSAFEKNGKVLINCNMGICRSTSFAISYLIKFHNLTPEEAFNHIKCHRSVVLSYKSKVNC